MIEEGDKTITIEQEFQRQGMVIPKPPKYIFEYLFEEPLDQVMSQKTVIPVHDHWEYPEEGGILDFNVGCPFPEKGTVHPPATLAANVLKRETISLVSSLAQKELVLPFIGFVLTLWKFKMKALEKILFNYTRFADTILGPASAYLKPRYYSNVCRSLAAFLGKFLNILGISLETAGRFARVFVTTIEWDTAYRYPLEDLFSQTTKEALLKDPRREIKRILVILERRDKDIHRVAKFKAFATIFSYALLIPRVKRAFVDAFSEVKYSNLVLDEDDSHNVLLRTDYNYFDLDLDERIAIHDDYYHSKGIPIPPQIEVN